MSSFQSMPEAQDHASPPLVPDKPRCALFRFLDLPAELQNLVYSFVVPGFQGELNLKHMYRSSNSLYLSRTDPEWKNQKRCALGLTQVCRKIRNEVLPLHISSHTVAIHPKQLTRYVEYLLLGPTDVIGTMVLRTYLMDRYTRTVNILPLVELCTSAPRFKAIIGSSEILPLTWNATCLEWIEFTPVELQLEHNTVELFAHIAVKKGAPKEYKDKDIKINLAYALAKDLRRWMDRVGLDLHSARVTVDSESDHGHLRF